MNTSCYLPICLPTSTGEEELLLNVTGYGSIGIFFSIAIGPELTFSFESAIEISKCFVNEPMICPHRFLLLALGGTTKTHVSELKH